MMKKILMEIFYFYIENVNQLPEILKVRLEACLKWENTSLASMILEFNPQCYQKKS
jgi:hypothetical protein